MMRLAPVALFYAHDPEVAVRMAGESSRTTHGTAAAIDACRYFAGLIVGALAGVSKAELLSPSYSPVVDLWKKEPLHPAVAPVAEGSFRSRQPLAIRGTGYVVRSLEAALWALASTHDFAGGALAAVNLGEDADTPGAVYGQLAGAVYGVNAIPAKWRDTISMSFEIEKLAERLLERATADRVK